MEENNNEIEINGVKYHVEVIKENNIKELKDVETHKVIIIGTTGVGKTSISLRLINQITNKKIETEPTISVDILSFIVKVNEKFIKIQLWDACGNEEFTRNTPNLFKNVELSIVVYVIDNKQSFEDVIIWNNILLSYNPTCLKYLIGNKDDLKENKREVKIENGKEIKKNLDFNLFFETSAESGSNINNLLKNIGVSIYNKKNNDEEKLLKSSESFKLKNNEGDEIKNNKKRKKKFC